MKRTLLLLFTLIVATMSQDDLARRIASDLEMPRREVQKCFNKTNATLKDLMQIEVMSDDRLQTIDFDDSASRAGCFLACLGQKKGVMTGARISVNQIKDMIRSSLNRPERIANALQALDICTNQVKSITNKCEVSFKCMLCFVNKMARMSLSDNYDE